MFRSLFEDFQTHLTPQLKRVAREQVVPGVQDIEPLLEELEKTHGRILLKLDTENGSWPFIRSIMASTRPHFWRTMVYMVITTLAAAAPALLPFSAMWIEVKWLLFCAAQTTARCAHSA